MDRRERITPGPGQESVWDYPRPPRLEASTRHIRIVHAGRLLADTNQSFRILETSHPPGYYLPMDGIAMDYLEPSPAGSTFCEWKGRARYWDLVLPEGRIERVAWSYPQPNAAYADLKDHLAFYPSKLDRCTVDDEVVVAQAGDFYGGWITSDIVGPFKGGPGTWGW